MQMQEALVITGCFSQNLAIITHYWRIELFGMLRLSGNGTKSVQSKKTFSHPNELLEESARIRVRLSAWCKSLFASSIHPGRTRIPPMLTINCLRNKTLPSTVNWDSAHIERKKLRNGKSNFMPHRTNTIDTLLVATFGCALCWRQSVWSPAFVWTKKNWKLHQNLAFGNI